MTDAAADLGLTTNTRVIFWVHDFDTSVRFYGETLGLELAYPAGGGWAEFKTGGVALCLHEGRRSEESTQKVTSFGWRVEDLDATAAALGARGVAVDEPHRISEELRSASFSDPSGNALFLEGP